MPQIPFPSICQKSYHFLSKRMGLLTPHFPSTPNPFAKCGMQRV